MRCFVKTALVGWKVIGGLIELVLPAKVAAKRGLAKAAMMQADRYQAACS